MWYKVAINCELENIELFSRSNSSIKASFQPLSITFSSTNRFTNSLYIHPSMSICIIYTGHKGRTGNRMSTMLPWGLQGSRKGDKVVSTWGKKITECVKIAYCDDRQEQQGTEGLVPRKTARTNMRPKRTWVCNVIRDNFCSFNRTRVFSGYLLNTMAWGSVLRTKKQTLFLSLYSLNSRKIHKCCRPGK